jgi:hypothetical protein
MVKCERTRESSICLDHADDWICAIVADRVDPRKNPFLLDSQSMHVSSQLVLVTAFLALGSGCVKKYVEVRVRDGGAVGVGAPVGRALVPVLAPDGSQGMVSFPPGAGPVSVVRQGHQVAAIWQGSLPIDLVDGSGAFPPMKAGEGIEVRGGSLYAYYNLTRAKVLSVGEHRLDSVPIALSTPANNIAEAVEIHEPYRWPAYVFLPTGGAFALAGGSLLALKGEEFQIVGWTYAAIGVPMLIVGLVNALQTSEAVPVELTRAPAF